MVNAQTGEGVQSIDYDAWGQITHLQNPDEFTDIGFAGGLYDRHIGLIRFGARDYDPQTGRWTAKDPILFDGGTSNLYEYALNDPVNNIDPFGLQALADSTSTYQRLSNSLSGIGLGAGASSAAADQYSKYLGQRSAKYLSRFSSSPLARMLQSNMKYLKMGRGLGGGIGTFCTVASAITDFQNPNVSNARASYRTAVGAVATVAGYKNPLLGFGISLAGMGLEYSYDNVFVPIANEFMRGITATDNALRSGRWKPSY